MASFVILSYPVTILVKDPTRNKFSSGIQTANFSVEDNQNHGIPLKLKIVRAESKQQEANMIFFDLVV